MAEGHVRRRLVAILAADVVGYSRLMGRDEAKTLAALKSLRTELIDPKLAEHNGRIFKATGDGLLAEFPSVVDAVACGVDLQRGMVARNADVPQERSIQLRIGVNIGDVIVEGEDIFGDGVNVAARLEGIAPPGGLAISGTVRDHLGSRLDLQFEDMGEQVLKNIDRAVRVYRVLRTATSTWVLESHSALTAGVLVLGKLGCVSGRPPPLQDHRYRESHPALTAGERVTG